MLNQLFIVIHFWEDHLQHQMNELPSWLMLFICQLYTHIMFELVKLRIDVYNSFSKYLFTLFISQLLSILLFVLMKYSHHQL